MKTLKKTLCLVLAVVMVVGALVLPASAKDYGDKADIGKDYTTAVTNLTNWKVMEGDATGNFKPKASIQRQEMAAIIYRLLTGDNEGYGKDNSAIYTPYAAKFTDVDAKGWAAGYIGYCANKGIIVGVNAEGTLFDPARAIPGNDVLCMLLRALGFGMNKEYQGAAWKEHVAADATRLHLTDGITSKLDAISQRQEVAQMTYKAATTARVTWSDAEKDYIPYVDPNDPSSKANISLIDNFTQSTKTTQTDYEKAYNMPGSTTVTNSFEFTYPVVHKPSSWSVTTAAAVKDYWVPVPECKVAEDTGLEDDTEFTTYTNGVLNVGSDTIEPLDTVNTIGHQGRHTLVYKDNGIIVYIDTYLARVTGTTVEVKDPAGHVITEATASLLVYSNHVANPNNSTATVAPAATPATATATVDNSANTYAVGDMLYVNVVTPNPYNSFGGTVKVIDAKKVTTETVTVASIERDAADWTPHGTAGNTLTEVGFKGTNGKTYLYNYTYGYNTAAAPVNGSSVQRILTQDIGKTYTVYLDSQGYVLGVSPVSVSDIGVVTNAYVALVTGTTNQYVISYEVLMPNGRTVTVSSVDSATQKPYTNATSAQTALNQMIFNPTTNPDAGVLARITPEANGYYTVTAAGTPSNFNANNSYTGTLAANSVLERGEANAFSVLSTGTNGTVTGTYPDYIGTPANISNILVDSSTVYFVANYPYNYTAREYQFKDFTISVGFKSVTDMSYSNVVPNGSTATGPAPLTGGTANIDGQAATGLNLKVSAFDTDTDGYADFVLVLNDNLQQVPTPVTVLNYAYLMNNRRFASTSIDQNVYGAIIDGVADQTLTLTAVASPNGLETGLYTYADQTINGWNAVNYVSPTTGSPYWGIAETRTTSAGWLVKDDVLVVDPTSTALGSSMNRGQYNPTTGTTFNPPAPDKYLTIANDCKVFLVNPTTGSSTPQPYALTTLDDDDVYGTNEIVYQFDANGYVNLIYIVAKGGDETTRDPATQIQSLTISTTNSFTVNLPVDWGIKVSNEAASVSNFVIPSGHVKASGQWQYLNTNYGTEGWQTFMNCGKDQVFNAATTYRFILTLTADEGYTFADNVSVTGFRFAQLVQGSPVVSNNGRTVTILFGTGAKPYNPAA